MASINQAVRMGRKAQRIKAFFFFFIFCITGGVYPLVMCILWGILLGIFQMKEVSVSLRGTVKYLYTPEAYEVEGASEGFASVFKANGVLGMIFNVVFGVLIGSGFVFALATFIGGGLTWLINKDTGRHILSNWNRGFTLASNKWTQREVPAEAAAPAAPAKEETAAE
ncbi:MAG: hypothetical protein R3Y60_04515 [bacterium]